MVRFIFALIASVSLCGAASGQENEPIPESCLEAIQNEAEGPGRWKACFDVAEPQSNLWLLSVINLGTAAFWEEDFETAAHYYRLSVTDETTLLSDVVLHAHRGMVFHRTGDFQLAKQDVQIAWTHVKNGKYGMGNKALEQDGQFYVLSLILQPMKETGAENFEEALGFYKAMTTETIFDRANRAAVLSNVGDIEAAIIESQAVIDLGFDDPGVYNNHCDMLTRAGRPAEALPFCEMAIAARDDFAPIYHTLAITLAGVGRCDEAETALETARKLEPSVVIYNDPLECSAG